MIGDVLLECELEPGGARRVAGFENHAGRTILDAGAEPLGRVVAGFGNDGEQRLRGLPRRPRDRDLPPRAAAAAEPLARRLAARAGGRARDRRRAARVRAARRRARGARRMRSRRRAPGPRRPRAALSPSDRWRCGRLRAPRAGRGTRSGRRAASGPRNRWIGGWSTISSSSSEREQPMAANGRVGRGDGLERPARRGRPRR